MSFNFNLVNCDTDSIMFCKPDGDFFSKEEQSILLVKLNELFPDKIRFEHDGIYDSVLILKSKNYILVNDGKYVYKGSSLKDTKREPAVREMIKRMITDIIENESRSVVDIYLEYIKEAMNVKDINRWAAKRTITKSILNADDPEARANESKPLDAINEVIKAGIIESVQEGDKVYFYEAIKGEVQAKAKGELIFYKDGRPKMIPNRILRDVRLWENDHNKYHYVDRVLTTVQILCNVLSMDLFVDYTLKSNLEKLNSLTIS